MLGGSCYSAVPPSGSCPMGTMPGGGGCYAFEGSTCTEGCQEGESGQCDGTGACNCVPGGGGGPKNWHCESGSPPCEEDVDCEANGTMTCFSSKTECEQSNECSDGGSGNGGGNNYYCDGASCTSSNCNLSDANCYAASGECNTACGGGGDDGYCCASNGDCHTAALGGLCMTGEQHYNTQSACNTACGGSNSNNCGNVTAQCTTTTVGAGETCGPTAECCTSGGELGMSGTACGTGFTCETNGNVSGTCVANAAVCGNGTEETGEECDDSNTVNNDGCSSSCKDEVCGDGVKQTNEECDEGTDNSENANADCRTDCTNAGCGDSVVDTGEECDDGNQVDTDDCKNDCTENVTCFRCGDVCKFTVPGQVNACPQQTPSENVECGVVNDACVRTNADECGNGTTEGSEECDDGNQVDTDDCKNDCTEPEAVCVRCGDGCTDTPETVDCAEPSPKVNISCTFEDDVCTKTVLPFCGDGKKEGTEECDFGDANNTEFSIATDGCAFDCTAARGLCEVDSDCAQDPEEDFLCLGPVDDDMEIVYYKKTEGHPDNIIYTVNAGECYYEAAGCEKEACISTKIYSCDCPQVEEAIICGDGDKEGDEECDDGNNIDDDGCSSSCFIDTVSTCSACGNTCVMQPECGPGQTCNECAETTEDFTCVDEEGNCERVDSLCGNGILDAGEECDGLQRDACTGKDFCLDDCKCGWNDMNMCGNDPAVCCAQGSTKRCCSQIATDPMNNATLCWPVGQIPPKEACDAIDPKFACSSCSSNTDCRTAESCIDGTCSLMGTATAWSFGDDKTPDVFGSTIGHSVVVFNGQLWDVYQERDVIFSSNNVASGNGFTWNEEGGVFSGAPSLDEFTHIVFDSKQWLIGGTNYRGAPKRTRDVWSSADGVIWQKHSNALPTEIDRHASVVFQNKIWIFGGSQGSTSASDTIYVSDNGTVWTQLANLPVGISYAEAVVLDGAIILLGGILEDGSVSNTVWKSNNGIAWTEVGSDALAGKNFANRNAAVLNNAIWIVGNSTNDEPTTYYSEDSGATWFSGPRPETNVFGGTDLIVLDDTLWLVGGYDDLTPSQADIVAYLGTEPRGSCNPNTYAPIYTCEEEEESNSSSSTTSLIANSTNSTASTASTASTTSTDGGTSGATAGDTSGTTAGATGGGNAGGTPGNTSGSTGGGSGGGTNGGGNFNFARAACGNGRIEGREACDDGNNRNRDGCSSSCEIELSRGTAQGVRLGQGATTQETLRLVARNNGCGNGLKEAGEQCDDGNQVNGDGCSELCKGELELLLRSGATCGNGLREEGEECDKGTENSDTEKNGCRTDCTNARCGDFVLDNGEQCDNGPANSDSKENACRTNCRFFTCGDGTIDAKEECDDGNIKNGDGCSSTCSSEEALFASASVCGDGIKAESEECDDGNARGGDGCNDVCQLEIGICGDGIVQELLGEQCESSLHDVSVGYACSDCQFFSVSCGDGNVDAGETCDNGKENSDTPGASCRSNCHMARCGDGVTDPQEECDDGNRVSDDGCDWLCGEETEGTEVTEGAEVAAEFTDFQNPQLVSPTSPTSPTFPTFPTFPTSSSFQFPQQPNYQQLPYQLPLAQLQPLIQTQGPVGDTGPAAVAVIGAGAAAGVGWMRRKKR